MNSTQKITLDLLKRHLNHIEDEVDSSFAGADWEQVLLFLREHAVLSLAWGAVRNTPFYSRSIPSGIQAQMKTSVMTGVISNQRLMEAQDHILRLFRENGIRCAVLKGTSVAVTYPQPELRVLGDIDLLLEESALGAAEELIRQEGFALQVGNSSFHIAYEKQGIAVELHRALSDMPDEKQAEQVGLLMEGALDHVSWQAMDPYLFPVLSPMRQALSLVLHMERHWVGGGIGLRQLVDWHTFIRAYDENTCREILSTLQSAGLSRMAMVFTTACVAYLGLDRKQVSCFLQVPTQLADQMMMDILDGGNFGVREKERIAGKMFYRIDREGSAEPFFLGAIRSANRDIQKGYPVCKKAPVLLPFFWVYLPLRYFFRSLMGRRAKQSASRVVQIAIARKKLYRGIKEA